MNAKGMATVGFLVLMPLLAAVLAFMASAYLIIRTDGKSRHACRIELLKSQNEVALILKDLLKLNPQAKRLRAARERAERLEYAARGKPPHPAALLYLTSVRARQTILAVKQKLLITEGRFKSRAGSLPASRAVATSVNDDGALYRNAALAVHSTRSSRGGSFDLVASPPDSPTPDYQPARNFEESQTMDVKWQIALGPLLPQWIQNFITLQHLKLNAECSATLTKEKKAWAPVLSADKS